MLYIGSHTSYLKDKGLLGVVNESISYGANIFMFYTGSNQSTLRFPIDKELTKKAHEKMLEYGLDKTKCIVHAPFIINLANNTSEEKYEFYINFLRQELNRCIELDIRNIVLHPGSYTTLDRKTGIKNIANPIHLDFYKKTIKRDFNPEKYKIKAIYGENGSGKTAIITAVKLLRNLLIDKNYLSDHETQKSLVEIINKKTRNGYIECEIYVDIDEDREILDYYISFEIKDDGRIYITEERLSRKNGNYSKNSYLCVFESKDGALEKFGNDKVYEFVKEKTLNLLDKQSFASSILTMMNDFPHDKDLNNDFVTVIELFAFAISLNVCIDNADIHTNNRLYQKIQSIEENKKDSFTKETFNQLKREILEASGRDILVPKNLYSSYEEQIAKLSMFIQIFKPELVNIEVDKKDFDQFYKCNLKMIYENYTLDQEFESRGIKKMMDLFYYLEDACMGMITFIDELDSNINDVYLDKIIEYFILYGKGQLCFTSHNLSPMSVLKKNKNAITFISSVNTVHTWANNGNLSPENAYKNGFIEDSPFNVDASDFLGILGGTDE